MARNDNKDDGGDRTTVIAEIGDFAAEMVAATHK